jgi:hypothetical protein
MLINFVKTLTSYGSELSGISYFSDLRQPDVLKRFQKQFWKQHLLPKKPRALWISGNILFYIFGVTQLGHFQCFWKIH